MNQNNTELITYKYKNKEISTSASAGFLTDFTSTKNWIEWLKKEFELAEADFKEKQFDIQFKNTTTQKEWIKLFYTDKQARKEPWGKDINAKEFKDKISWPPIYLHPIMEDTLNTNCIKCGNKQHYDNRKIQEFFQAKKESCYDWEKGDNVYIVTCEKCGFTGGIFKKCSYRICEDHGDKETSEWWRNVWYLLKVNPNPDRFKGEKSEKTLCPN